MRPFNVLSVELEILALGTICMLCMDFLGITKWQAWFNGGICLGFVSAQEVDGESFLSFTEQSLAFNFNNLIFGQRNALMKVINRQKQDKRNNQYVDGINCNGGTQFAIGNNSIGSMIQMQPFLCGSTSRAEVNSESIVLQESELKDLVFIVFIPWYLYFSKIVFSLCQSHHEFLFSGLQCTDRGCWCKW